MPHVRSGVLIAIIVSAVFVAYAFLAPATYRTSALLVVDSFSATAPAAVPEPLEAGRRLSEAILDRQMLEQLSRERAESSAPDAQAHAASEVRQGLQIDTSDAHAFSISYKDNDKARAQRVCNQLVHHAVERAPVVLLDRSAEHALDLKRQEQTQELAAFLALHPQVAAEAPSEPGLPPEKDPAITAFHAEKNSLERRLADMASGKASDNPYVDPADGDPNLLHRRLTEIDSALAARKTALESKPPTSQLSPDLRADWKRLLDAVSQSAAASDAQVHPSLVARVAAEAPLPKAPIDPNRPLLIFLGLVFGIGLGSAFTLVAQAAQQRRKSSRPPRPPNPSQGALTVHLPAAPAVPRDLGPGVAAGPPGAGARPPAAATEKRSSSGPPPAAPPANGGFGGTLPIPIVGQPIRNADGTPPPAPAAAPEASAPLRFASTLVLPPAANPTPIDDPADDPVLASAAQAWDAQIRAHEVPGFAVVRPRSEPPGPVRPTSSVPPPVAPPVTPPVQSAPIAAPRSARPMKVTQPLGSFMPDGIWNDPKATPVPGAIPAAPRSPVPPPRTPVPPRSPVAPRSPLPPRSPPEAGQTGYSYVSTPPPAPVPAPADPPPVIRVQPVTSNWAPDPSLNPQERRGLCEQLYPCAVENCFVVAVISVPESRSYKSRVAAELALALAESGHPRILLLEGDFHRPLVQRLLSVDMPMGGGFSQQLHSRIQGKNESRWTVVSCSKSLHVLAEGVMRSPGLMLSRQFAEGLKDLRSYYDFIVIDGPTTSLDVDSKALDAVCDGLVTVCPANGSPALAHMQTLFSRKRFSVFASSG